MFRTRWATVWVLILTGVFGNAAWGQAFIENVWPPAFDRGSVTRVTLEGTEIDQPVAVWSSLSDPYLQARHSNLLIHQQPSSISLGSLEKRLQVLDR